jgi:hypothetical protein
MKTIIVTLLILLSLVVPTILIVKSVQLEQNCTGYLKRAADANTVELALRELTVATNYLEKNNLTSGYTSIIYRTPDEDIGFWYTNLIESKQQLELIDSTNSILEKTNVLMKLRETLLDGNPAGDTITVPNGLSRFPHNGLWAILSTLSVLFVIGAVVYGIWDDL